MTTITSLPIEIISEIFVRISKQHEDRDHRCSRNATRSLKSRKIKPKACLCWKLDTLSAALVCTRWYYIVSRLSDSMDKKNQSWSELANFASKQRVYLFRSRFAGLLKESMHSCLPFRLYVRHLVIDFQSFNYDLKNTDNSHFYSTLQLLRLCPSIEQLDIVFDASFLSLVSNEPSRRLFISMIFELQHCILHESQSRIKQLKFVGYNPLQRCPCCAGKVWDVYLLPLLKSLRFLETLVLQHVLPSQLVFDTLANKNSIQKIVLNKSVITIPRSKEDSDHKQRMTTIGLIPDSLWKQVKTVEIYEDIEESTTWPITKYISELTDHVQSLESFSLQFGSQEDYKSPPWPEQENHLDFRPTSPLLKLKTKCGGSLKRISLVNVPETFL
ncbi:hypothetical protein BY458DRAFT_491447 [Sporodiniella umbellata]|nr:hypothetical protein BY458DRAFT_491447 [Sporodiniella umbellata]